MTYAIAILRRAQRESQRLLHEDYERMREAIRALAQNPGSPGCLALTGGTEWRIRVGNYRYNAERQGLEREFREEVWRVLDLLGASSMCAMAHTKYTPAALLSMPDGDHRCFTTVVLFKAV